jgi:hypothetical protein
MSAFGTKRTLPDWVPMSAIGGKADVVDRSLMPSLAGCDRLTHPAFLPLYDFPKKVHYPVSCYRDGGENADGAEPTGGRAKQHLSESTDTKAKR